ncbi:unnamed protein product, partial [Ectocarpus sp. 13 AM-2016]
MSYLPATTSTVLVLHLALPCCCCCAYNRECGACNNIASHLCIERCMYLHSPFDEFSLRWQAERGNTWAFLGSPVHQRRNNDLNIPRRPSEERVKHIPAQVFGVGHFPCGSFARNGMCPTATTAWESKGA